MNHRTGTLLRNGPNGASRQTHLPPVDNAALAGKKGSLLWVVSAETGEKLSEYRFMGYPAWDGLIAANENLYLTMQDGTVICMKEK